MKQVVTHTHAHAHRERERKRERERERGKEGEDFTCPWQANNIFNPLISLLFPVIAKSLGKRIFKQYLELFFNAILYGLMVCQLYVHLIIIHPLDVHYFLSSLFINWCVYFEHHYPIIPDLIFCPFIVLSIHQIHTSVHLFIHCILFKKYQCYTIIIIYLI